MTRTAAYQAAGDLMDAVVKELKKEGKFTLPSFGTFTVRKTKARKGLNPRTGESIKVKAGKTVRFKASPSLKKSVISHATPIAARPGFGVLVVALGTLVVPFDSSVTSPSVHHPGVRIADPGDPMGGHRLYADLRRADAGVRPRRRYAGDRRIFLAGSLWSLVAFVLCALAPSYGALLSNTTSQEQHRTRRGPVRSGVF